MRAENIKSGFKTAGVVPYNPVKVRSSAFLIQTTSDDIEQRPRTPPTTIVPSQVLSTPTNRRKLYQAIERVDSATPVIRPIRDLITKTGRTIDRLQFDLAVAQRQITTYKRTARDYAMKSKKQGPIDLNQSFATVEHIKNAYNKAQLATVATRRVEQQVQPVRCIPVPSPDHTDAFGIIAERLRAITRQ